MVPHHGKSSALSLVSTSLLVPPCAALGGVVSVEIANEVVATATGWLVPGTPVTLHTSMVLAEGLLTEAMKSVSTSFVAVPIDARC